MFLKNFKLARESIALEMGEAYFDLHNDYDFIKFEYGVAERILALDWQKNPGHWVSQAAPKSIRLKLKNVYLFKVHQRDPQVSYSDDNCLSTIGFGWNELLEEMDTHPPFREPEEKRDCLTLVFESGQCLKVRAESAELEILVIE